MMKVHGICLIAMIALGLLGLTGCPSDTSQSDEEIIPENTLTVFLLDLTRSFLWLQDAKNHLAPTDQDDFYTKGMIGCQKNNDVIAVVGITNYAKDEDTIIIPTTIVSNMYDPNIAKQSRQKLINKLNNIDYIDEPDTDMTGALYKAGIILSDSRYSGETHEKYLVIYSDLGDSNLHNFNIDLTNVNVVVLFFSPDMKPESLSQDKPDPDVWKIRFKDWGAKSVNIVYVDNSYGYNPYE